MLFAMITNPQNTGPYYKSVLHYHSKSHRKACLSVDVVGRRTRVYFFLNNKNQTLLRIS